MDREPFDTSDLFLCFGTESLFLGAWLLSPPVSLIVVGVIFSALAVITARAT